MRNILYLLQFFAMSANDNGTVFFLNKKQIILKQIFWNETRIFKNIYLESKYETPDVLSKLSIVSLLKLSPKYHDVSKTHDISLVFSYVRVKKLRSTLKCLLEMLIYIFSTGFTRAKKPKINFSSQTFSEENSYSIFLK